MTHPSPRPAPDRPRRAPLDVEELAARLCGPGRPLDRVDAVETTGSTNDDLAARLAAGRVASGTRHLLVAEHQSAGRGRLGRRWEAPAGSSLTFSVALGSGGGTGPGPEAWPWYGFAAALAVVRAVRSATGLEAGLEWPNDVLVPVAGGAGLGTHADGRPLRKCCGVLSAAVPGHGLVLGLGLDVDQAESELPVPTAVSLAGAGGTVPDRADLLVRIVEELGGLLDALASARYDAEAAGLADEVREACVTLGWRVDVSLPSGTVSGTAQGIDHRGRLVLLTGDATLAIEAGDVVHVRPADR